MSRFPLSVRFLALALLCALAQSLHAQIDVRMDIPRHFYLCYEPIVATVTITNNTGRDITLADHAPDKWFSFEIMNGEESPLPPLANNYHLDPLLIPMGQTVKRQVNLVNLYPVTDYGIYKVRATVYMADMDKYFSSNGTSIEVTEGTSLWHETVGIPAGETNAGQYRSYELLSFRQPKDNMLYVRIQDKDAGIVYATLPLGRMVTGYPPDVQVDAESKLHILCMVAPKEYLYTQLGPNAEFLGQQDYADLKTRPYLKKTVNGDVAVGGGVEVLDRTPAQANPGPKISDRPPGMPR